MAEVEENLRVAASLQRLFDTESALSPEQTFAPQAVGDFKIVREIGRGGMGIVYEAEQPNPRRLVALKLLRPGTYADPYRLKLFRREAQALARLRHPGIAAIHESGHTADGQHYLVMELVSGLPLDAFIRETRPDVPTRLALFQRLCDAINYAHQRGVVHLDIKPANVLVDQEGRPKVLDFGLARIMDPDATMATNVTDAGKLQGTLPYMSPEQLRGDPASIDSRSDVYSLGVILYELLTGRLPHEVTSPLAAGALWELVDGTPRRPSTLDRALRGDLETIMLKTLEKDPAQRYPSALILAEDLERYATNQPILAHPPSSLYQLRKLITRHKLPFVSSVGFVLLVIAFGVWMSTLYARAQHAERLAQGHLSDLIIARDRAEDEADRARRANTLAEERLAQANQSREDIETIAEFQASMLNSVDPAQLGHNLLADLRRRIEATLRDSPETSPDPEQMLADLDEMLAHLNRADLGIDLLHENILERASQTIAERLGDQPLLQARLRSTIGGVYDGLGDYERAEPQLTAARTIRLRELGPDHANSISATADLAFLYHMQGRETEAAHLLTEALERRQRLLGREHPDTLATMNGLGNVYRAQGRYDEAERVLVETVTASRCVLGEEHPDTLIYKENLALLYKMQTRYEHAEALYLEVLEARRRLLGTEHPETLTSKQNLAKLYISLKRYTAAETLLAEIVHTRRRERGTQHPDTLRAMSDLAELYSGQGYLDEAESLSREALESTRHALGLRHPMTLHTTHILAMVLMKLDYLEEAEALLTDLVATSRIVHGEEHPTTVLYMGELSLLYIYQHRPKQAKALHLKTYEAQRRNFGEAHRTTITTAHNLAFLYAGEKRYEEAERLSAAAVAGARTAVPDSDFTKGAYSGLHGRILKHLGRYEESEVALLEALRIFEIALSPGHRLRRRTIQLLGELYEAWGKPDRAAEHRALLLAFDHAHPGQSKKPQVAEARESESSADPD
jgi:serine/threonine protein kinase